MGKDAQCTSYGESQWCGVVEQSFSHERIGTPYLTNDQHRTSRPESVDLMFPRQAKWRTPEASTAIATQATGDENSSAENK